MKWGYALKAGPLISQVFVEGVGERKSYFLPQQQCLSCPLLLLLPVLLYYPDPCSAPFLSPAPFVFISSFHLAVWSTATNNPGVEIRKKRREVHWGVGILPSQERERILETSKDSREGSREKVRKSKYIRRGKGEGESSFLLLFFRERSIHPSEHQKKMTTWSFAVAPKTRLLLLFHKNGLAGECWHRPL